MRLALALGMTMDRLGREMPAAELADWLAFDEVHGLPDPLLQTGVAAAAALAPWRAKGSKPPDPERFIPARRPKARPPRQSREQVRSGLRAHMPPKLRP